VSQPNQAEVDCLSVLAFESLNVESTPKNHSWSCDNKIHSKFEFIRLYPRHPRLFFLDADFRGKVRINPLILSNPISFNNLLTLIQACKPSAENRKFAGILNRN
jgi:hypothetical protein